MKDAPIRGDAKNRAFCGRFLIKVENSVALLRGITVNLPQYKLMLLINRDQIVVVIIDETNIAITTTIGTIIKLPIATGKLAEFRDELTANVGSNFLVVPK